MMAKSVNVRLGDDQKTKAEAKAVDLAALLEDVNGAIAAIEAGITEVDAAGNLNQLKKVVKDLLKREKESRRRERAMLRLLKKLAT